MADDAGIADGSAAPVGDAADPELAAHALAPDPTVVEEVRAQVGDLLAILGVVRVIGVDDDFVGDVADLVECCELVIATAGVESASQISNFGGVNFDLPEDDWKLVVQSQWSSLEPSEQRLALADARQRAQKLETAEQLNAGGIAPLLPETVAYEALTPDEWSSERRDGVVASAAEEPTLVLFDKQMGAKDGMTFIGDLHRMDTSGSVWAGLLTHHATKEDEQARWDEWVETPGVARDRFVVISKEHLGPNPSTLPQSIKVALMARPSGVLRAEVSAAVDKSLKAALDELERFSPQEFERIVFALAAEEGVWEPDMLLRLVETCLRTGVRREMHKSPEVRQAADDLRRLASVETAPSPTTDLARKIYRRELYEDVGHLNGVHLPVELGDLFETAGGALYVIVEQPCDIAVRSDGKRAPDLDFVDLVAISPDDPNADGRRRPVFPLPAFNDDGSPAWVLLDRPGDVPVEAVDYCVFNTDGEATIRPDEIPPPWLWPSWQRRYDRLAKKAKAILGRQAQLNNVSVQNRALILKGELGIRSQCPVKVDTGEASISFDLRRVGRLLPPHAKALLTAFSQQNARDDLDRPII